MGKPLVETEKPQALNINRLNPREFWVRGYRSIGFDPGWKEIAMESGLAESDEDSLKAFGEHVGTVMSFVWQEKTWRKKTLQELDFKTMEKETEIPERRLYEVAKVMVGFGVIKTEPIKARE